MNPDKSQSAVKPLPMMSGWGGSVRKDGSRLTRPSYYAVRNKNRAANKAARIARRINRRS